MIRFIKKDNKFLSFLVYLNYICCLFQQTFVVSSQVAFMFVLFLACSVNLASANAVCTECGNNTADSASKKVSSLSSVFIVSGIKDHV